ncbi:unnamed protein product [Acanthoscelides obtectus]|nr:unnamed protein product [Acanthoscelides obtectus]CAK1678329.1 hypothetical protein AOBTE_LOCUS31825 [Acanthoscelides obtectus]
MSKNASSEKKSSSPAGTKKQNVIIFKPDEIAKFGLFGDNLVAGNTKTTNPGRSSTPEESEPSTSRHNASISPKMKRGKSTRENIKALSVSGDTSVSTDTQSGIDVKRKIGDILKKTFQEMKKFEPDKFQPKNTSSVSGTKVSLDCDKKSEIVSLLKHAKNKKEAGIETESIEAGVSDSSKKVKVIGITSVKYSDEEIQSILKGSGNSNPKSNTVVQSDDSTASKLTNKVVASELPTQKTSPTKSSQFDSKGNTVGSKYKHGHVDEIIDLEEKIIPAKKAPREHVDAKALVANKDLDRINIDKNASIADTSELLDSEGSKLESITSTTIEKKVSETQSVVDFNNPADFDYYIIQFPPSDDTKSTCDKDKTCNTEVKAVEQESVAETTEEIQKELIDDETKPAKKLEEIDIEDELSYSVLTMEKSEDPNEPEDEVPKTKKLAGQELTDPDVTSEKVVKVINVEKHPEPVGDESIFKVNVVLEVPKPEVVDTVQFCPRKRKQQIDCKVDEEEPFEKTNKHRTKKNRIEDDECMVDSSKFKCIKQYGVKPHLTNQNPIADMAGETDLLELNDLASVVRIENDESLEEAAEEVQPMDSQQVTTDEVKPAPKKRGRPRRKQLYMDEDVPATVFCPIESSKSGRKRRKINYFNLENSLYGEMEENSSGIGKKKGRPRKVKTEDELTVLQTATDESFGESSADVSLAEIVESKTSVKQNPEEPTGEDTSEPGANKEEFLSLDKVRKYRRTGKTVEMVNSIFTAAMNTLNETQNLDTSVDGQKEQ